MIRYGHHAAASRAVTPPDRPRDHARATRGETRGRSDDGYAAARRGGRRARCGFSCRSWSIAQAVPAATSSVAAPRCGRPGRGRVRRAWLGRAVGGRSCRAWSGLRAVCDMARGSNPVRRLDGGRAAAAAASSAGRMPGAGGGGRRRRRAAEREVGDGREALPRRSRSASSRWAMRSAEGSAAVLGVDAPAVDAAAAGPHEQRAGLADEPDAERAALEHEAGARVQVARLVADEVAEQAERGALRPAVRARPAAQDVRAALGVQLGDHPRVREQRRTRPAPPAARAHSSTPRRRQERDVCATVVSVHSRPRRSRRRASTRGRQ